MCYEIRGCYMKSFELNVDVKTDSLAIIDDAVENSMREAGASEASIISGTRVMLRVWLRKY